MRIFLNGGGDGKICEQAYNKLNQIIDHTKPILYIPNGTPGNPSVYKIVYDENNVISIDNIF